MQDQIARHVGERRDVVAERRPRIAVLHELLAGPGERLAAREPRRVRDHVREPRRSHRHEHDRLARSRAAARVDDAQPGLEIIDALLGGQHAQEADQPVDRREAGDELAPGDDAARVRQQSRQIEADLPEDDTLEHGPLFYLGSPSENRRVIR